MVTALGLFNFRMEQNEPPKVTCTNGWMLLPLATCLWFQWERKMRKRPTAQAEKAPSASHAPDRHRPAVDGAPYLVVWIIPQQQRFELVVCWAESGRDQKRARYFQ